MAISSKRKKKVLYRGEFKQLVSVNGWEFIERVNCGGIVVILAVTGSGKAILIDQYRVPVGKRVIEFPAGLSNDIEKYRNETLRAAAKREFLEETGFRAGRMTFLASGPANPAISGDIMTVFLAGDLKKVSAGGGDASEDIRVYEVDLRTIESWLRGKQREGFLVDPKVYAGIYLLEKLLKTPAKKKTARKKYSRKT